MVMTITMPRDDADAMRVHTFKFPERLIQAIDQYRWAEQRRVPGSTVMSRSEVVRRLVTEALATHGMVLDGRAEEEDERP